MHGRSCDLTVDWCGYDAARFACLNWHYSKSVPAGKLVRVGAWEDGRFIGCVIFSRGANNNLGTQFGLGQDGICELTRVALTDHKSFVSEILVKAIGFLKTNSPGLKAIISYSDTEQGHKGGIYQATNWLYLGRTTGERYFIVHGKKTHPKSIHSRYGTGSQRLSWLREHVDAGASEYTTTGKHKYIFPLSKKARKRLLPHSKRYPQGPGDGDVIEEVRIDLSDC